jgi:hypothetical protein
MAATKGKLDPLKKAAAGIAARIPFLPKRTAASPEPFSAIEDDTPLGDLLSAKNAAPGMRSPAADKPDFRALFGSLFKSPPVLIGSAVVLVFLLTLAVVALVVSAPPKATAASLPFTEKGEALVRTWLPPPGDPFEKRMPMEREGAPSYSPKDAARIGLDPDPGILARVRDRNDEAMDEFYGTVP